MNRLLNEELKLISKYFFYFLKNQLATDDMVYLSRYIDREKQERIVELIAQFLALLIQNFTIKDLEENTVIAKQSLIILEKIIRKLDYSNRDITEILNQLINITSEMRVNAR